MTYHDVMKKFDTYRASLGDESSQAATLVLADTLSDMLKSKDTSATAKAMTKGDMCKCLERVARDYVKGGIRQSLRRNVHLHQLGDDVLRKEKWGATTQDFALAILTDFINKVAMDQGLDLGLHSEDLQ